MDVLLKVTVLWTFWSIQLVTTAPSRQPRLSLAEQSPSFYYRDADGSYTFGYDVLDPETGNTQFRSEERYPNGTVAGSYGYVDAWGKARKYDYVADDKGYRVLSNKLRQEPYTAASIVLEEPSTEASVVWTRPPKRKNLNKTTKPVQRRQHNRIQRPSYYLLY